MAVFFCHHLKSLLLKKNESVPFSAPEGFAPPSSSIDPPTPVFSHPFLTPSYRHVDLVPWPINAAKNHVQSISRPVTPMPVLLDRLQRNSQKSRMLPTISTKIMQGKSLPDH
jgi:hypothetical protein